MGSSGAGPYSRPWPWRSGHYQTPVAPTIQTVACGTGSLRAMPLLVPAACTLTRIGCEVTTGAGSTVVRLGIYSDSAGGGYPDALLLDAGTVDGTSAAYREITISQAVTPGIIWLVAVSQVGSATLRSVTGDVDGMSYTAGADTVPYYRTAFIQSSVTGALGANFTATPGISQDGYRVVVKVA